MTVKLIIGTLAVAVAAAGCSSSGGSHAGSSSKSSAGSSAGTVTITLSGGRLTAPNGHTLYYNTVDTASKIACTGGCASEWPPLTGTPHAGAGVDQGDLSTAARPGGGMQVTYYGHPLYEFVGDTAAGEAKGNGDSDAGGKWVVATPDQASSTMPTTSVTSPAASSGGGGGGYGGY